MHSSRFADLVLESIGESIILTKDDLDPPGPTIVYVNRAFEKMTGYSAAEALGRSPRFLQGPRTDRPTLQRLRETLGRGEVFRGTAINYRKNGEEFINGWYIVPATLDGERHFLAVQRDLTEDERFAALAIATTTNESAAFMLAGIRHELGNPINSIKAALGLLRDQGHALPRERVTHYLDALLGEVGRIERLLRGLRAMNAFERPRARWSMPATTIGDVRSLAQPLLREHAIEWREHLPKDVWAMVDADALHQILMNLVKNSVEAMAGQRGGVLQVALDVERRRVVVDDNGPGIAPGQVDHLFRPFFSTKTGGSGLGLYVARRLASEMECSLEIQNLPERGTRVSIGFPESGWKQAAPRS
jgi:PAS domain S-box-containing protein